MNPSSIRFRHLRTFVAVAREGSIMRAATQLSVTQPAVSKAIRELETVLGTELLGRNRGGAFLSPHGQVFLRHAEASLTALRRGVEEVEGAGAPEAQPVRIGALPTVSARLLPEAVRRYLIREPGSVPRIVTGPTDYLTTLLRRGDLDIMIGRMGEPGEMTGLMFEHLYSERIVFVVRPGHPLVRALPQGWDAGDHEWVLPPPGSVIRPTVDRLFVAAGFSRPKRMIETVSLAFSRTYVLATNAIWVISEGVVLADLQEGWLLRLRLDTEQTQGPVGITLRAGFEPPKPAAIFLDELRKVAEQIRQAPAEPGGEGRSRLGPGQEAGPSWIDPAR